MKKIVVIVFLAALYLVFLNEAFAQTIVINEIQVRPGPDGTASNIQSLKNCTTTSDGVEWVEFYNNSNCAVDISCYIFITESWDGARDGAFRFPTGTSIPARSFFSIGGPGSGATINLATYCSNNHMVTNNTRWYLENGDAWCALYSAGGTLMDAVFWTVSAGQSTKWPTDTDLDDTPPYIPSATSSSCVAVAALSRPSNTIGTGLNDIEYAGAVPAMGSTLARTTDGATTWMEDATPTINNCNGACIAVGSCAMPVEITLFDGEGLTSSNFLYWNTAVEINNDYFILERSYNAYDFEYVTTVDGNGTSNYMHSYNYDDWQIDLNIPYTYYRLKQVDFNGDVNYSNIVSIKRGEPEEDLIVFPVPADEHLSFIYNSGGDAFICSIYDITGKLVFEQKIEEGEESDIRTIDVSKLPDAVYVLHISSGQKNIFKKIAKN